jgi:hypothetical protein
MDAFFEPPLPLLEARLLIGRPFPKGPPCEKSPLSTTARLQGLGKVEIILQLFWVLELGFSPGSPGWEWRIPKSTSFQK